ncbi:MAG TPA: transglutaminase-like domain-containing protein [Planctomycetota bacterium]|nr:transglutaminase-like domain-containing protein [Planctomycetota bacterium]HRR79362.1 transglutaminase-like domain-containing protein [Planctomycetota bacterium]
MATKLRVVGVLLLVVGGGLGAFALTSGRGGARGEPTCRMQVKDRVITGAYKSYGLKDCVVPMWLAKTVFRNGTDGRITKLKFRYKLGEYADWTSWHQYEAVDPTQTVVDLYHPILSSACAKLTSRAPAEIQMECEYLDPAGKKQEIQETKQITLLGRHEFVFSDLTAEERTAAFQDFDTYSPLLAAWVSRQDDPVSRLASMANKKAGGVGASTDDESCIKVMKELYDIMRTIRISYQHPQALADPSMSYDVKLVQSLQYPRDTIQKRSGTCIDLAILYAALLNSVNITPYLVSMDGHCFPIGQTPSGRLIPVEATGVGDGGAKSMNFAQAIESGMKTWNKVNENGRFNLVNLRECWVNGVSNPELEPLPADILEKWGVVALVDGADEGGERRQVGPTPPPPPPPQSIAGQWVYSITAPNGMVAQGQFQIAMQGNQVALIATSAYQMQGPDGMMHQFTERNDFTGTLTGQMLVVTCNNAVYTMDGMQVPPQGLPLRMTMAVAADGRSMRGQVVNSMGMMAGITAQR